MTVWRLNKDILAFPDPHYGEEDGLIAVGGDLSVNRLLLAYSNGIFPWYGFKERREIMWFCPMDRFVIFPGKIHVSHSISPSIRLSMTSSAAAVRLTADTMSEVPGWAKI